MSGEQPQQIRKPEAGGGKEGKGMAELPLQSSPYVKYTDLEDYKQQGYGTQGHLPTVDIQGGGTDAPTISGSGLSENQVNLADAVARHGAV